MLSRVHGPTDQQAFSVHRLEMLVFIQQALTCYLALFFFIQYTYIFYHWLEGVYYHFIGASHQAKRSVGAHAKCAFQINLHVCDDLFVDTFYSISGQ